MRAGDTEEHGGTQRSTEEEQNPITNRLNLLLSSVSSVFLCVLCVSCSYPALGKSKNKSMTG